MTTDIVVTTCERLPLLKKTLEYIWERTKTGYRLHVIDDASTEGNQEYLRTLEAGGSINRARLHRRRVGIAAHLGAITKITVSDPVVFTDDDVLCPRLKPDWLARGLKAMRKDKKLGLLALNNPQCNIGDKRRKLEVVGAVTLCRNIPGNFVFVRRAVLDTTMREDASSPVKALCLAAGDIGWKVGYLTDVYCQHIGTFSSRNQNDLSAEIGMVMPVDLETLEPVDEYKG
ncbi:MAG: glycosyltransferase family A protein [Candidatus Binatia bacterium]|nr:glycosyltransferase family A protein [Candidatus Binatia bacterium]